ncbi:hypothetical protein QZJ86_03730 [Methylomonas montana]|uniref:hypothetical protein n=1 Tax=Methylomonas montana TaxID=3058963 RepID=UPI00265B1792|nr:hypothetical protein [Methylomonas montana]WKJ91249.1 hypothetical protein QZJ86_03730 [Methylomonas montana]
MQTPTIFSRALVAGLTLLSCAALTGCGQDQAKSSVPSKTAATQTLRATSLLGAVSNNAGPIKTGSVKLLSESGAVLASTELNNSPRYEVPVPSGTTLPVILSYSPSANAAKDETLISAIVHPDTSKYDINPTTTAIAKQAKAMGGYTHNNMVRAAENTAHVPDANKTTSGFRGDPTSQYGGWH